MCSPVNARMSPAMTPETTQPMPPAPTGNLQNVNVTSQNFTSELQSFFALCLMNLVFGSLAMAFGMQFIVTAVLAMAEAGTFQWFSVIQVLLGWAAAVVGLRWIISTAGIFRGVNKIRREFRAMEGPVSNETITSLIIRMMAHYRENWKAIWRMNLISTLGGSIFLVLGVLNLFQGISAWLSAEGILSLLLAFVAAGINLTIGVVSLLFSSWFRRYARAWDHRLIEATQSEEALKHAMEKT
jgi:hypothetical protein